MEIDTYKCVACPNCVPVCPMGAIYIDPAVNNNIILKPKETPKCDLGLIRFQQHGDGWLFVTVLA